MTPKEKAQDLYQMYYECLWHQDEQSRIQNAKQCAKIAVDEIIKECIDGYSYSDYRKNYWQEVKQEIESHEEFTTR